MNLYSSSGLAATMHPQDHTHSTFQCATCALGELVKDVILRHSVARASVPGEIQLTLARKFG